MPVQSGQDRSHTISFEIIQRGVQDPINSALSGYGDAAWVGKMLTGLAKSVLRNSDAARHVNSPKYKSLFNLAVKIKTKVVTLIKKIVNELGEPSPSTDTLTETADDLIKQLNSSPDNLRPGDGSTNRSIGPYLDLIQKGSTVTLPQGTLVADKPNGTTRQLASPTEVILIDDADEQAIRTLLTSSYSELGAISLYTSEGDLQSSENAGQLVSNMKTKKKVNVAVDFGTYYVLFKID